MPQIRGRVKDVQVTPIAGGSVGKVWIKDKTGQTEKFLLWGTSTKLTEVHSMWISQLSSAVAGNKEVTIAHSSYTSSQVDGISLHGI